MSSPSLPRVPHGQIQTTKWPVLHYGDVPTVDTAKWTFSVSGMVERSFSLTWDEFLALPRETYDTPEEVAAAGWVVD